MKRFSAVAASLPVGWLLVAILAAIAGRQPAPPTNLLPVIGPHDVYAVSSPLAGLPIAVAALVFAGGYLALEMSARRYSRRLGALHLALQSGGFLVTLLCWRMIDPARLSDPAYDLEQFRFLNGLARGGFLLSLAGLGVFAVLIGQVLFRRRAPKAS